MTKTKRYFDDENLDFTKKQKVKKNDDISKNTDMIFLDNYQDEIVIPTEKSFILKLNGVAFKKFTKIFDKPVDMLILDAMKRSMDDILEKYHPTYAYTRSDKMILIFIAGTSKHIYGGHVQKICSCIASYCTLRFNHHLKKNIKQKMIDKELTAPSKDCEQIFDSSPSDDNLLTKLESQLESVNDDYKYFECKLLLTDPDRYQENKFYKNTIENAYYRTLYDYCHYFYPEKYINPKDIIKFKKENIFNDLEIKGINFDDLPDYIKNGTFVKNEKPPGSWKSTFKISKQERSLVKETTPLDEIVETYNVETYNVETHSPFPLWRTFPRPSDIFYEDYNNFLNKINPIEPIVLKGELIIIE